MSRCGTDLGGGGGIQCAQQQLQLGGRVVHVRIEEALALQPTGQGLSRSLQCRRPCTTPSLAHTTATIVLRTKAGGKDKARARNERRGATAKRTRCLPTCDAHRRCRAGSSGPSCGA